MFDECCVCIECEVCVCCACVMCELCVVVCVVWIDVGRVCA